MLPAISAEGKLVGKVQIIWAGETERCHPEGDEIDGMSDLILHSHSLSHWTTESTILEYLAVTYVLPEIIKANLSVDTQKWVLSCWR